MKEVKRFVVVTQIHEATVQVEDDWKEGDEVLLHDTVATKPITDAQGNLDPFFFAPRIFDSVEEAEEFQQSEIGRL